MANSGLNGVIGWLRNCAQPTTGERTDGDLLHAFLNRREERAFEALLRRHGPMVLGVCRRVLRNDHAAEDAFQATFLVLARKARSIRRGDRLGGWLYEVAFRTACRAKAAADRRQRQERQVETMPEPEQPPAPDCQELLHILDQELTRLPDDHRQAVVLCDLEGRSRQEVARQLNWPAGTLSSRLARARGLLARRLTQRGVTLSAAALAGLLAEGRAAADVPPRLLDGTAQAAQALAAGQMALSSVASPQVAWLTEGVIRAMFITKLKTATAALLGLLLLGGGMGLLTRINAAGPAGPTVAAEADPFQEGAQDPPPLQPARPLVPRKAPPPKIDGVPAAPAKEDKPPVFGQERLQQLLRDLIQSKRTDSQIVEALYMATLGRLPNADEIKRTTDYLAKQGDRETALADYLWALLNSLEHLKHVGTLNPKNNPMIPLEQLLPLLPRRLPEDPNAPGRGPFFEQ